MNRLINSSYVASVLFLGLFNKQNNKFSLCGKFDDSIFLLWFVKGKLRRRSFGLCKYLMDTMYHFFFHKIIPLILFS